MLTDSLEAERTSPPKPKALLPRASPRFDSAWPPSWAALASVDAPESFPKADVELKRKPGLPSTLRSKRSESWRPSSTPNSSVSFKATSAISTWIITMGGRSSSCSTRSAISSKKRGVALTIRLLLTGSGTTTTSRSICSKALNNPGVICWTCRSLRKYSLIALATSWAGAFLRR